MQLKEASWKKCLSDMQWLQSLCKGNRDFVTFLRSPVIKSDKKGKIVEAVTQEILANDNDFIYSVADQ